MHLSDAMPLASGIAGAVAVGLQAIGWLTPSPIPESTGDLSWLSVVSDIGPTGLLAILLVMSYRERAEERKQRDKLLRYLIDRDGVRSGSARSALDS